MVAATEKGHDMTAQISSFATFFTSLAHSFAPPVGEYSVTLLDSFYRALAQRLEQLCAPLLQLESALFQHARNAVFFSVARQPADQAYLLELNAGAWEELLIRKPMLRRVLHLAVKQWRTAALELAARLAQDADVLRLTFGVTVPPATVRFGISDMHNGGRSAAIVCFPGGRKLVYKPKDFSPDQAWHDFSLWLKNAGAPWYPSQQTVLERDGYGWSDFVESRPCESATEQQVFFFRLGHLQALLYLLGATDCHRDNFIAHGAEPVLVDLETLLHPPPPNDPMPAVLRNSVLSVEILPCRYIGAGNQQIYFPGFDGEWETGDGTLVRSAGSSHASTFSLRTYGTSFAEGFAEMYRFLMRHKEHLSDLEAGPLATFRGCTVRYVHRPTTTYALTLRRALRHLDERHEWGMPFEQMRRYDLPGLTEDVANSLRGVEYAALEQLDIPFFTSHSDSTALHWKDGGLLADFFATPALELARQRAQRLTETDLTLQLAAIRQALAAEGVASYSLFSPWAATSRLVCGM